MNVRPVLLGGFLLLSSLAGLAAQAPLVRTPRLPAASEEGFQLLPLGQFASWNPEVPWGGNDGALWQGRGISTAVSAGIRGVWGPLSLTLAPEALWAQNLDFEGVAPGAGDYWGALDRVRRYSETPRWNLDPGQSEVRVTLAPVTLGLGTANLWFGPARHSSILMTDQGPGFPHLDLGLDRPWATPWGAFQGTAVWGQLSMTGGEKGFYHALVLGYTPPGLEFLTLGAARAFISPWNTLGASKIFQSVAPGSFFQTGGADDADQQASLYFSADLASSGFQVYGELARNDSSGDLRDLILQPDHGLGYVWGLRQKVPLFGVPVTVGYEQADLGNNIGTNIRPTGSWYRHAGVGATHGGQLLGASIGPGSNSNTVEVVVQPAGEWSFAGLYERVAHDVDYVLLGLSPGPVYQDPNFGHINYLDVSTEFQGRVTWTAFPWAVTGTVSFLKELNRNWVPLKDLTSWRASLDVQYRWGR